MKRGTPRHPKMIRLLQALGLGPKQKATAIGYLELLWHFTAEFAPQGDIGRYDDDQIEGACEWYGRRGRLIESFTTSGWCDLDCSLRLKVHDWHDHADDAVRKRLQRAGLSFLTLPEKVTGQRTTLSGSHPDSGRLPEPEPEPEPSQSHIATPIPPSQVPAIAGSPNGAGAPDVDTKKRTRKPRTIEQVRKALGSRLPWFEKIAEVHPAGKLAVKEGMEAFERIVSADEVGHKLAQEMYRGAVAYAKSHAASCAADPTTKVKYMQGWLNSERWTDVPGQPPPTPLTKHQVRNQQALAVMKAITEEKRKP